MPRSRVKAVSRFNLSPFPGFAFLCVRFTLVCVPTVQTNTVQDYIMETWNSYFIPQGRDIHLPHTPFELTLGVQFSMWTNRHGSSHESYWWDRFGTCVSTRFGSQSNHTDWWWGLWTLRGKEMLERPKDLTLTGNNKIHTPRKDIMKDMRETHWFIPWFF